MMDLDATFWMLFALFVTAGALTTVGLTLLIASALHQFTGQRPPAPSQPVRPGTTDGSPEDRVLANR